MRLLVPLMIVSALTASCSHRVEVDVSRGSGDAGTSTDAGADGGAEDIECSGLDLCECWREPACEGVHAGCSCYCAPLCPTMSNCVCHCGGGPFLGCVPASCEWTQCQMGEVIELDADGCANCVPLDCNGLSYCDCKTAPHCNPVTNEGFCACNMGCDPEEPDCDCPPPPFEPSYAGCADHRCPRPQGCHFNDMFIVGADGCPACAPIPDP